MPYFTTSDHAKLWYDDWNTQPGPILFFLHGFTSYRISWGHHTNGAAWLLSHQLGNYRCVFMETRGCNASHSAPGPYTIQQQALDVIALCNYLRIDKFTFCGHSMGGGTGFQLAATVPERLHKLVLMAPLPSNGAWPKNEIETMPPRQRTHILHHYLYPKWKKEEYRTLVERFQILDEGRPSETLDFFKDRARMCTEISEEYWVQGQHSMKGLRLSQAMETCQVPTLMIAGATDALLMANVMDVYRMPNAVLHVCSSAGHETALHDPNGVALAIHHFMNGRTISQKMQRISVERKLKDKGYPPIPPRPKL